MKLWTSVLTTLAIALTLSGCASDYVIATKEGQMLLTQSKPKEDKSTGLISYIDEQGTERQINRANVSQIIER
ncbi:YgdI/YgdR family lipoprotein [Affinibrenneria salicis]|uniref:YgdI/YgdR family lipoprotein n=1 Tax=Affinibrenneria salicis TaxID=2590031 RepID=A0A5J5FW41_9GAMM|nr:YgdI/YgdR family lipoprotein [Affinibrenneria salicis]KAA8997626.1 YgdI/YgdR family lipoprotein [Affinibrenneria salicis]